MARPRPRPRGACAAATWQMVAHPCAVPIPTRMRSPRRGLALAALALTHRGVLAGVAVKEEDRPQLSANYVAVLTWYCEETDHEAAEVCNLLWTHNHLLHTDDVTQLRGLSKKMCSSIPGSLSLYLSAGPTTLPAQQVRGRAEVGGGAEKHAQPGRHRILQRRQSGQAQRHARARACIARKHRRYDRRGRARRKHYRNAPNVRQLCTARGFAVIELFRVQPLPPEVRAEPIPAWLWWHRPCQAHWSLARGTPSCHVQVVDRKWRSETLKRGTGGGSKKRSGRKQRVTCARRV